MPIIKPGIIAGALMAFTLSIDDFVITFFTAGAGASMLPFGNLLHDQDRGDAGSERGVQFVDAVDLGADRHRLARVAHALRANG